MKKLYWMAIKSQKNVFLFTQAEKYDKYNAIRCKGVSERDFWCSFLFTKRMVFALKVGLFNTVRGGVARFAPYVQDDMDMELVGFDCPPLYENLDELKKNNCEALIYNSDHQEDEAFFKKIADCGVKYICCSCAGYDHFNLPAMKKYGLKGANVPVYSPNAISEHTVMLLLGLLRNFRIQILQVNDGNYQLKGLQGREIRNMIIGIVGAGRIGYTTMKCLSGFGPKKMYAYDLYQNDKVKEYAEYITLEELYEKCDVLIYHTTYNEANHHMVNPDTIAKMKDGVILVNCARGGLFDADAVLKAVENGKIAGVGLDVIEEEGILKKQPRYEECPIPVLRKLLQHPNVIYTPHSAFYTDEAERNLSEGTVQNLNSYRLTGACEKELVK